LNQALFLPEAADWISSGRDDSLALVKSVNDSEFVRGLQEEARRARIAINVGVHEPTDDGRRTRNTLLWIGEDGSILQRYQKLHLFDANVKDGPSIKESEWVSLLSSAAEPY